MMGLFQRPSTHHQTGDNSSSFGLRNFDEQENRKPPASSSLATISSKRRGILGGLMRSRDKTPLKGYQPSFPSPQQPLVESASPQQIQNVLSQTESEFNIHEKLQEAQQVESFLSQTAFFKPTVAGSDIEHLFNNIATPTSQRKVNAKLRQASHQNSTDTTTDIHSLASSKNQTPSFSAKKKRHMKGSHGASTSYLKPPMTPQQQFPPPSPFQQLIQQRRGQIVAPNRTTSIQLSGDQLQDTSIQSVAHSFQSIAPSTATPQHFLAQQTSPQMQSWVDQSVTGSKHSRNKKEKNKRGLFGANNKESPVAFESETTYYEGMRVLEEGRQFQNVSDAFLQHFNSNNQAESKAKKKKESKFKGFKSRTKTRSHDSKTAPVIHQHLRESHALIDDATMDTRSVGRKPTMPNSGQNQLVQEPQQQERPKGILKAQGKFGGSVGGVMETPYATTEPMDKWGQSQLGQQQQHDDSQQILGIYKSESHEEMFIGNSSSTESSGLYTDEHEEIELRKYLNDESDHGIEGKQNAVVDKCKGTKGELAGVLSKPEDLQLHNVLKTEKLDQSGCRSGAVDNVNPIVQKLKDHKQPRLHHTAKVFHEEPRSCVLKKVAPADYPMHSEKAAHDGLRSRAVDGSRNYQQSLEQSLESETEDSSSQLSLNLLDPVKFQRNPSRMTAQSSVKTSTLITSTTHENPTESSGDSEGTNLTQQRYKDMIGASTRKSNNSTANANEATPVINNRTLTRIDTDLREKSTFSRMLPSGLACSAPSEAATIASVDGNGVEMTPTQAAVEKKDQLFRDLMNADGDKVEHVARDLIKEREVSSEKGQIPLSRTALTQIGAGDRAVKAIKMLQSNEAASEASEVKNESEADPSSHQFATSQLSTPQRDNKTHQQKQRPPKDASSHFATPEKNDRKGQQIAESQQMTPLGTNKSRLERYEKQNNILPPEDDPSLAEILDSDLKSRMEQYGKPQSHILPPGEDDPSLAEILDSDLKSRMEDYEKQNEDLPLPCDDPSLAEILDLDQNTTSIAAVKENIDLHNPIRNNIARVSTHQTNDARESTNSTLDSVSRDAIFAGAREIASGGLQHCMRLISVNAQANQQLDNSMFPRHQTPGDEQYHAQLPSTTQFKQHFLPRFPMNIRQHDIRPGAFTDSTTSINQRQVHTPRTIGMAHTEELVFSMESEDESLLREALPTKSHEDPPVSRSSSHASKSEFSIENARSHHLSLVDSASTLDDGDDENDNVFNHQTHRNHGLEPPAASGEEQINALINRLDDIEHRTAIATSYGERQNDTHEQTVEDEISEIKLLLQGLKRQTHTRLHQDDLPQDDASHSTKPKLRRHAPDAPETFREPVRRSFSFSSSTSSPKGLVKKQVAKLEPTPQHGRCNRHQREYGVQSVRATTKSTKSGISIASKGTSVIERARAFEQHALGVSLEYSSSHNSSQQQSGQVLQNDTNQREDDVDWWTNNNELGWPDDDAVVEQTLMPNMNTAMVDAYAQYDRTARIAGDRHKNHPYQGENYPATSEQHGYASQRRHLYAQQYDTYLQGLNHQEQHPAVHGYQGGHSLQHQHQNVLTQARSTVHHEQQYREPAPIPVDDLYYSRTDSDLTQSIALENGVLAPSAMIDGGIHHKDIGSAASRQHKSNRAASYFDTLSAGVKTVGSFDSVSDKHSSSITAKRTRDTSSATDRTKPQDICNASTMEASSRDDETKSTLPSQRSEKGLKDRVIRHAKSRIIEMSKNGEISEPMKARMLRVMDPLVGKSSEEDDESTICGDEVADDEQPARSFFPSCLFHCG